MPAVCVRHEDSKGGASGWCEWESLKAARPGFPVRRQGEVSRAAFECHPGNAIEIGSRNPPANCSMKISLYRLGLAVALISKSFAVGADLSGSIPARLPAPAASSHGRPLVGAIRWDAWQENNNVQATVERTLGPSHWHYRLPFFARITGSNSVVINGNTPAIMDQEIDYAANAGIDYWAFCTYPDAIGMSHGLHLYLNSPRKRRINFALNLQGGWVAGKAEGWDAQRTRYVNYFKDVSYQNVLGNRPLVFLFNRIDHTPRFPDAAAVATAIHQLRAATTNAGLGNPYIVFQGWNARDDFNTMQEYGLDAIGAYAVFTDPTIGSTYPALAAKGRGIWEAGQATGANVVPIVTAGWDNRPRYETPTPWTTGSTNYTLPPTPAEFANHLAEALDWTGRHRSSVVPANTVLIYAWNENDEGGWLVPTLNPDGSTNSDRLTAIAATRKSAFSTSTAGTNGPKAVTSNPAR